MQGSKKQRKYKVFDTLENEVFFADNPTVKKIIKFGEHAFYKQFEKYGDYYDGRYRVEMIR